MRFNPYRPNSIVTPEMFQGRTDELVFIQQSLLQTRYGNPQHFLIEGERGLGKSSLFLMVNQFASGKRLLYDGTKMNFLVLNIELDASQTFFDIIRNLAAEFQRALSEKEQVKMLARDTWNFLSNWEILGVRYHKNNESLVRPYEVLNEIVKRFEEVILNAKDAFDGILLLIDEADRPSVNASLGEIVKLLTEKLTKRGCDRLAIGMTGQPGLIDKLKASHESSSRIFTTLLLKPLTLDENIAVIQSGLSFANTINQFPTKINQEALRLIAQLSEGYPHFLQEFAYKAFEADSDWLIDEQDVKSGAYGTNGALNQLGHKYFNDIYFAQIGSDDYRRVLQSMARYSDEWVDRSKIKDGIEIKDTTLNNAIIALKNRAIIIPNVAVKGEFRLPTKSFAAWIKAFNIFDDVSNPLFN
jgi:hypothetical protein